jgi:hypothetical protein
LDPILVVSFASMFVTLQHRGVFVSKSSVQGILGMTGATAWK